MADVKILRLDRCDWCSEERWDVCTGNCRVTVITNGITFEGTIGAVESALGQSISPYHR